jgi:hypothetical protein
MERFLVIFKYNTTALRLAKCQLLSIQIKNKILFISMLILSSTSFAGFFNEIKADLKAEVQTAKDEAKAEVQGMKNDAKAKTKEDAKAQVSEAKTTAKDSVSDAKTKALDKATEMKPASLK